MRAVTLTSYVEVARFVALDPFKMLREVGIGPQFLDDPENRWAAQPVIDLLENSARKSGCESFGLLMTECRTYASLGPLSLLLQHLPTPRDVVQALIDFRRLMNDVLNFALEDDGETTVLRWELLPQYAKPQIIDVSCAMAFMVLKTVSNKRFLPSSIHLTRRAPSDLSIFRRFYSLPVEFESSFNGISCPSDAMALPNPMADDAMAKHALGLLQSIPIESDEAQTSDSTRRAIALLLPSGAATLDRVATNLGLSPRALQRGLEKEGRSFAGLLNETRREMAQRYLANSERPITSIADLMGYASLSAFGRWFASEFGVAPHVWRSAQLRISASTRAPGSYQ
jgi:AraC-like DNA-binding protein